MLNKVRKKVRRLILIFRCIYNDPQLVLNGLRALRLHGFMHALALTYNRTVAYRYKPPELDLEKEARLAAFPFRPLISVVMPVYNVDAKWLDLAVKSVQAQWYNNWELCIVDDCSTNQSTLRYLQAIDDSRIRVSLMEENGNISAASNRGLAQAQGDYILLLDNDDELAPDTMFEVVTAINEQGADFLYSDEDLIDSGGNFVRPHFKADFSPALLLSHNYITHICCFKKSLLDKAGAFDSRFDGAQDYDLILRLTEQAQRVVHIPKVLYHWRMLETSTSRNAEVKPEALERGRQLVAETLARRGIKGEVLHGNLPHYFRIRYELLSEPLVSIIIPFKDKPELLKMCVESILNNSTYTRYEIIGVSNNSVDPAVFAEMERLEKLDPRVHFHEYNEPFNYSAINNYAVRTLAKGEHVVLLNNDIEILSPDWIEALLEHSQRPEVGCVGAKLYYPNDTIQHAGVVVGIGGSAGHSHKGFTRVSYGYYNRLNCIQNFSAVTGACLMVKKALYEQLGGLNEVEFAVALNDVDFCLRVRAQGYLNVFTPYCEAYHHESVSRGYEDTEEKQQRLKREQAELRARHPEIYEAGDPYYNPNLTLEGEDFGLNRAVME